jgi:hypothetical protein
MMSFEKIQISIDAERFGKEGYKVRLALNRIFSSDISLV